MSPLFEPVTPEEVADAVRSAPRVLAVGATTKPRLSQVDRGCVRLSTVGLRGLVEYDPDEFTFTARAGTPMSEIVAALAERGQHLPFDPLLVNSGATLGGTVAAGLSGPGRFRFGGLRDFILGVRFVDGGGRLLRMGGKVVKNAAGFDLPKFFVGSLGRFGVLAEITLKVFPRPAATRTLRLIAKEAAATAEIYAAAGRARWALDALDASPDEGAVFARLAGPGAALDALAGEILARWPGGMLTDREAEDFWHATGELAWAHPGGVLCKIVLTPARLPEFAGLLRALPEVRARVSAGGNVALISVPSATAGPALGAQLRTLGFAALTLRGDAPLWPGWRANPEIFRAMKTALDPQNRFPSLDEP
ncbi:MAG: FAD-binding protein [Opitutaceae bacterium]|nr:FAD-binding protein [Opitutaceae bacterium]